MPSFSIGRLMHWLADMVSISVISYSFGSMMLLLGSILYGFWSPSIFQGHYKDTHQLSWQEPFSYEAKVYAALSPDNTVNGSSFFETAQLLWHIPPQSVENRYPLLRHKAVVNVPSRLLSGSDLDQRLFAYVFIQEAGQFGPHPNMSDPRLVSSRIPIARWKGACPSNSSDEDISATCREERTPELQYVSGASWAIVLENNAYPWGDLPDHIPRILTPLPAGLYNPPLSRNDFTKSRPEIKSLATLKDKGLATDEYPLTVDVELELAGIKQGWILARAHLHGHIRPTTKAVLVERIVPAPWDPTQNTTLRRTELVCSDGLIPLDAVRRLSVPLLLAFVLSRALIVASLPLMVQFLIHPDSMSASKWMGMSRATISIMYMGTVVGSVQVTEGFGAPNIWALLGYFVVTYIGVNMDDMTFVPLSGLSWLFHNLFWRKSPVQGPITVATDKGVSDPAAPKDVPLSHTNLVDPVVAIRRSVDKAAMYWVHLLSIPVVVVAVFYFTLIRLENSLLQLLFFKELSIGCIRTVQSVVWLPQIIVNYKAKSGSLVPAAFVIPMLIYSVASAIFYQLSGYSMFGETTAYSLPVYLGYITLIVQWLMYRNIKQD
ncbi:hypothetical protein H4S04_000206 [Coemansia sp. S16]|nr:hypothetical protein GGI14_005247 [Coemansia sp. S680]KAJ2032687.1 hypothetical protein H4S03_006136 [Coemansia sp. S3946]KAJ2054151.1 hypothetical protein H4S04_000206 [Coemansia sp. S16]